MKRTALISVIFILFTVYVQAQNRTVDSLLTVLRQSKNDTTRVNNLLKIAAVYFQIAPDSALAYSRRALEEAELIPWKKGRAEAHYYIGLGHYFSGNYYETIAEWKNSLVLKTELGDKKGSNSVLGAIGGVCIAMSDYENALEYCLKALKTSEELNDKQGISNHLGNIAIVYQYQAKYEKAEDYYRRAMAIHREQNNKIGEAQQLGNLASLYYIMAKNEKALEYALLSLKMLEDANHKQYAAHTTGIIGAAYDKLEKNAEAEKYYLKAIAFNESLGNKGGLAWNLFNAGNFYCKTKRVKEGQVYLQRGLELAQAAGVLETQKNIAESLYSLYSAQGHYEKALSYYKQYAELKDSMFSEEKHRDITRHEMNYEFQKKEAAAKQAQEKKDAVAVAESKKQKIILLLVSVVLMLVIFFSVIVLRALKLTRKQKNLIEKQKAETEFQKKVIEEKNRDIIDSIQYAKRIQTSIMPSDKNILRNLIRLKRG